VHYLSAAPRILKYADYFTCIIQTYGLIATQKTLDCRKPNEEFHCKVLSFVKSNLSCSHHQIDKVDEDTQRELLTAMSFCSKRKS
jgi:hypothetical protein